MTELALEGFPDTHAQLTVTLIDSIRRSLGDAALETVIAQRETETRDHYRARLAGAKTMHSKLKRLTQLRTDEGYMAELERVAGRRLAARGEPLSDLRGSAQLSGILPPRTRICFVSCWARRSRWSASNTC